MRSSINKLALALDSSLGTPQHKKTVLGHMLNYSFNSAMMYKASEYAEKIITTEPLSPNSYVITKLPVFEALFNRYSHDITKMQVTSDTQPVIMEGQKQTNYAFIFTIKTKLDHVFGFNQTKKTLDKMQEYKKNQDIYYNKYVKNRAWYHFDVIIFYILGNKYYHKIIFPISPIIIILYDCIFNDWVITHVYYYLLLYIPVMLFRRFTILLSTENDTIGELIWDILYKKESCIYALPKDHRKLFDVYIANGIKTVDLGPPALLDFGVSWFINKSAQFIYNEKENLYYNGVDRSLELLPDKKLVYRHTNHDSQQEVDEEWYVIAVKYHYSSEGKYEIIIHNN